MSQDAELVARIRDGDLKAFEALYDKYKGQIFRTALAITQDHHAAEEVLQDCFVRAYDYMDTVDASYSLSPWLHRIAVNLSRNWVAKRKPWPAPLEAAASFMMTGPGSAPEEAVEIKELRRRVREVISSLSFKHRSVVVLFYLWDFSLVEIAYILDVPEGTVKSRLYYARERLRSKLESEEERFAEVVYEFA